MAGRGPAPKQAAERRRANAPAAGEWIELPATVPFGVPAMPARGKGRGNWSTRTRRSWKAWWSDPVATQWGPGDRDLVEQLAEVFEAFVREPTISAASEIRQLRDNLGLTPKGRQDRRWKYAPVADVADIGEERKARAAKPARARIRAVDPAVASKG